MSGFNGDIGKETTKTDYTKTTPRKWTKEEEEWALLSNNNGMSKQDIAKELKRSVVSVEIKIKRLKKRTSNNMYNEKHVDDKYKTNLEFEKYLDSNSKILDLYCGINSYWKNREKYIVKTNDIDKDIEADYNLDALKLLCKLYYDGEKFDMIDLDPFGSAYECFDLALKMSNKAIIITFGEIGHKRWKRLDFVGKRYGIENIDDFNIENLIKQVQKMGLMNKKKLTPIIVKNYQNISRVYFLIERHIETSQWKMKTDENT